MPSIHPRGLGAFWRALAPVSAGRDALRARQSRLSWAALMVETPNGHVEPIDRMRTHSDALRDQGLAVWLWTFPALKSERAAENTARALEATGARGVILDIEVEHKGEPGATAHLVASHLDVITERHGLGVTSYPIAAMHRMPWPEMSAGFGMPQLYRSAANPSLVERAVREYGERHGGVVVPAVAAYLGDHELLRSDLIRVSGLDKSDRPRVDGMCIWSWPQISGRDRGVCAEFCDRAGW